MNSKMIKYGGAYLMAICLMSASLNDNQMVEAHKLLQMEHQTESIESMSKVNLKMKLKGIFSKMIELEQEKDDAVKEKEAAKERKRQQLEDAEKEHDQLVKEEEMEEAAKAKAAEELAQKQMEERMRKEQIQQHNDLMNSVLNNEDQAAQISQEIQSQAIEEQIKAQVAEKQAQIADIVSEKPKGLLARASQKFKIDANVEEAQAVVNKLSEKKQAITSRKLKPDDGSLTLANEVPPVGLDEASLQAALAKTTGADATLPTANAPLTAPVAEMAKLIKPAATAPLPTAAPALAAPVAQFNSPQDVMPYYSAAPAASTAASTPALKKIAPPKQVVRPSPMNTKTTVLQTQPVKPVPQVAGTPLSQLMPPAPAEVTPKVVVKTGPSALPQVAKIPIKTAAKPVVVQHLAQAPVAAPVQAPPAEQLISQDKIQEIAQKLGVPATQDLLSLKSNDAISSALIDKAVSAGKTEAQINAAMSSI